MSSFSLLERNHLPTIRMKTYDRSRSFSFSREIFLVSISWLRPKPALEEPANGHKKASTTKEKGENKRLIASAIVCFPFSFKCCAGSLGNAKTGKAFLSFVNEREKASRLLALYSSSITGWLSLFFYINEPTSWWRICQEMNENTFLIFTGIHPSLSLFQENIETEVMDSWWRVVKRLFSFLLLVQNFMITLLNDQDYSPDGRLIVNVILNEVLEDQEKLLSLNVRTFLFSFFYMCGQEREGDPLTIQTIETEHVCVPA